MATKKERRQRALDNRARFLEHEREVGLKAQGQDHENRRRQELSEWRANHEKNHSWKKRITECPHCQIEMRAAKEQDSSQRDSAAS